MWSRGATAMAVVGALLLLGAVAAAPVRAQVGPLSDETPHAGTATFTDLVGGGTCSFPGEPPDNLHVGVSTAEFGAGEPCGGYLDVAGPLGTVRIKITDRCVNCRAGLLDLSRTGFARIADVDLGRVPVAYQLVRNPPLAVPITLRVKDGSSRWWFQIQVLDHGNPLAQVELHDGLAWRPLVRSPDNFWTASDPGPGDGPFGVRITDVFGQSATADGILLAPGELQRTDARLYPAQPSTPTTMAPPGTTGSPESASPPAGSITPSSRPLTPTSVRPAANPRSNRGTPDPSPAANSGNIVPLFAILGLFLVVARLVILRRRRWPVGLPSGRR